MKPHILNVCLGMVLASGCGGSGTNRVSSHRDPHAGDNPDASSLATNRDGGAAVPDPSEVDAGALASESDHAGSNGSDVNNSYGNESDGDETDTNPSDGDGSGDQNGDEPGSQECERDSLGLSPSVATRLSNEELNNSIAQLLPANASNLPWLPTSRNSDVELWSFPPMTTDLEGVQKLAQGVAIALTSSREQGSWLAGCDPIDQGEEECRKVLLNPLVERIFRRPLTEEDEAELLQTFDLGKELGGTFDSGARAVLEVTLQGPEFLYLMERGNGQLEGSAVQLTGHETAARLAFLLTGAAPDAELRNEAAKGPMQLSTIETQARRLIADSSNQKSISRTLRDLLLPLEPRANPEWDLSAELAQAADEATLRFVESVTFQGAGTLDALLTQPTVWANGELATFYGYPVESNDWQEIELDASRAAGVLTQPAFLAATSNTRSSPVLRGLYVLRNLLCFEPPPPPTDVLIIPEPPTGATQRQQLEAFTAPSGCADCHQYINPVGFAFEHYDAVGKWRDEDNGEPVDASGVLIVSDAKGPFAHAVELMNNVVETQAASACFVERWLQHALRRELVAEDTCFEADLTRGFKDDRQIQELLIALAKADHFRYRLAADLDP